MPYPNAVDYFSAVQNPGRAFRTSSLQRAQLARHPVLGTPVFASGNSAVVCKATVDGEPRALRFFTREDASSREQYLALGRYFREHHLTDCVATSEWLDDAIEVNEQSWPVLRMQWIEGRPLDAYVGYLVNKDDAAALQGLAEAWRRLIRRLQTARFAHGDLQHGNVLVDTTSELRLVDFDGSWIPPFDGRTPPTETGHRNYQRPNRPWDQWMDTFPGLLIYTSLVALSKDTNPWRELYDDNNLLFERADFDPPYKTAAWDRLARIGDEQLDYLLAQLRRCCAPDWVAEGRLDELLGVPTGSITHWWDEVEGSKHPTGVTAESRISLPLPRPPVVGATGTDRPIPTTPPHAIGDWWESKAPPLPPVVGATDAGKPTPSAAPAGNWWESTAPPPAPGAVNGPETASGGDATASVPTADRGGRAPRRRRGWRVALVIAAILTLAVAVAFALTTAGGGYSGSSSGTASTPYTPYTPYQSDTPSGTPSETSESSPSDQPFPNTYGDDPELDDVWDSCESGDGNACNDLYWRGEVDSVYESYGDTCGNRYPAGREGGCPSVLD